MLGELLKTCYVHILEVFQYTSLANTLQGLRFIAHYSSYTGNDKIDVLTLIVLPLDPGNIGLDVYFPSITTNCPRVTLSIYCTCVIKLLYLIRCMLFTYYGILLSPISFTSR
jgi:hypothetical protein